MGNSPKALFLVSMSKAAFSPARHGAIKRNIRVAQLVLLFVFGAGQLWAACNTSTLTTTPDSSSFATCWNYAASHGGGSITVLPGSANWTSQPTLDAVRNDIKVQGATASSFSGTAGQSNYAATWNDSSGTCSTGGTCITLSADMALSISTAGSGFVRISGITFIANYPSAPPHGVVHFSPAEGEVGVRFDHNHVLMYPNGLFLDGDGGFGLIDHDEFDDTGAGGGEPVSFGGDFVSGGYLNWQQPLDRGTNQGWYVEADIYTATGSANGFIDRYFGAPNVVVRFNTVKIDGPYKSGLGWGHGLDSGDYRSPISLEVYGNYFDNGSGSTLSLGNTRGGTLLFWGNDLAGPAWTNLDLQYYRCSGVSSAPLWGSVCDSHGSSLHLNWTPVSATATSQASRTVTLNAPNWQPNHSYVCSTSSPCEIAPSANNRDLYNYISTASCVSGGTEPTWTTTFPFGTTGDGTCTWTNVGGNTAASPNPGGAAGFCQENPDTTCTASSSGCTCNRYLDPTGGVPPFRDQPGMGPNQTLTPNYAWLNTGTGTPSPILTSDNSSVVVPNLDYYNYTSSFTGASGVGSGSLSNRPSTCTPGVAYWDTSEGSWNQSGNGFGEGELDICTGTNKWTDGLYVPYTYPDPLEGTSITTTSSPTPPPPDSVNGTVMPQ